MLKLLFSLLAVLCTSLFAAEPPKPRNGSQLMLVNDDGFSAESRSGEAHAGLLLQRPVLNIGLTGLTGAVLSSAASHTTSAMTPLPLAGLEIASGDGLSA